MSATNSTTHYELPSFLGGDKPAWLVDWNGAMATIDSAIYEAKQAADTASASAGAVASDLATLSGTVSTLGSTISTLSETLTTAVGNINTINSLIGNGTPTTTDQTIIGAINEINANVTDTATSGTLANTVAAINTALHDYIHIESKTTSAYGTVASGGLFTIEESAPAVSGYTPIFAIYQASDQGKDVVPLRVSSGITSNACTLRAFNNTAGNITGAVFIINFIYVRSDYVS